MQTDLQTFIRDVPDFPKEGIVFKDITPLLQDSTAFRQTTDAFAALVEPDVKHVVSIESRGFIFGAALAQKLGIGLTLVRKPGKLPRKTIQHSYALEYGTDTLEIHADSFTPGEKVVIIDDVLATGGTAAAAGELCRELGVNVTAYLFLMELSFLNGRNKLKGPVNSLLTY